MGKRIFQIKRGLTGLRWPSKGSKRALSSIASTTLLTLVTLLSIPWSAHCIDLDKGNHNKEQEKCPEGMKQPRNCDDVRQMAYKLAAKKGYKMGSDNIPNVMQRRYVINKNDCSTGNAHIACMFNDECTEEFGKVKGMRSNSAHHATTMYVSKSGKKFECDFTPQSSGIFIRKKADTVIGDAVPDAGESMDPAYDCKLNGANFSPLGEGSEGGGAGGMSSMMSLLTLMSLLQGMNQQPPLPPLTQPEDPPPPAVVDPVDTPTPIPTPTPTAVATATSAQDVIAATSKSSPAADVVTTLGVTSAWEEPRGDMFE